MLKTLKALFEAKSNAPSGPQEAPSAETVQSLYKTIATCASRMPRESWDRLRIEMEFSDRLIEGAGEVWLTGAGTSVPLPLDLLAADDEPTFIRSWQTLRRLMAAGGNGAWTKGMLELTAAGRYSFEFRYAD